VPLSGPAYYALRILRMRVPFLFVRFSSSYQKIDVVFYFLKKIEVVFYFLQKSRSSYIEIVFHFLQNLGHLTSSNQLLFTIRQSVASRSWNIKLEKAE
jgi:hypothetical protein